MQLAKLTSMPNDLIQAIVEACVPAHFTGGDAIVTMGDDSPAIFFLIEGTCALLTPSLQYDAANEVIGEIGPGEFFGELSLRSGAPATAHVHAKSIVVCHALYREEYELIKLSCPRSPTTCATPPSGASTSASAPSSCGRAVSDSASTSRVRS